MSIRRFPPVLTVLVVSLAIAGLAAANSVFLGDGTEKEVLTGSQVVEKAEPAEKLATEEPEAAPEPVPNTTPPLLTVTDPAPGTRVREQTVRFSGLTEPGAQVWAWWKYEADVDGSGKWWISLRLQPGGNLVKFGARDAAGNAVEVLHKVYYEAPVVKEEPKEESFVAFTANQKFGSCAENPPYDVFWGTAPAGSKVWAVSEFGSGSTFVGKEGHWELRVFFPEAPVGKTFLVSIKSSTGAWKKFEFTRTG